MRTISRSKLIIRTDRHRQEFNPESVQEKADSIEKVGLLHAPVVRETPEGLELVAGETRIKAMELIWELGGTIHHDGQLLQPGEIPYTTLGELDELAAEEAQLEENLKRTDLTWQEHSLAVKRLHNLRIKQQGEQHTISALAVELTGRSDGGYREAVRQELLLADHLDKPEVQKAKTAAEAFKVLKTEARKQTALGKAEEFQAKALTSQHTLLAGDCLEQMKQLLVAGNRFDVILTDPPYGMGAQNFGNAAGRLTSITHEYDDGLDSWRKLMLVWCPLSFQLAAERAHAYVFCDIERYLELKQLMEQAGWYVHRTPIIYYKTDGGRVPLPDIGPRRCWEMLLYAVKGKKPVTNIYPDVVSATADTNLGHGAQKPVACYQNLLQRSVLPGDKVLDTFCGTGTIFAAAQNMKCIATGIELDKASFGIAAQRLEKLAGG